MLKLCNSNKNTFLCWFWENNHRLSKRQISCHTGY